MLTRITENVSLPGFTRSTTSLNRQHYDLLAELDWLIAPANPRLAPLVNWTGGAHLPIHRWFRYREGFSPQLIEELGLGDRLLDPFCGTGSILVGSAQLGRNATGIDVNPLATFAARVKLSPLTPTQISSVETFRSRLPTALQGVEPWPAPRLAIAHKVFEPDILRCIQQLKTLIEQESTANVRDFLLLGWLAILQRVGSYFQEGNGIKYRNKKRLKSGYTKRPEGEWQLARFGRDQRAFVIDRFLHQLDLMVKDTTHWESGQWSSQIIVEQDALSRDLDWGENRFHSIIFSPPYANRFDYFEALKVELWFGGFARSYSEMRLLRKKSMRSHLGSDLSKSWHTIPVLENLINLMDRDSYAWRMRVPALLRGYFDDMRLTLLKCRTSLRRGGTCYIVVGNSAYGGVIVPTDSIIALIGLSLGFSSAQVVPVRHLTVAPQQRSELKGFEEFMRESVVVLK